VQPKAVTQSYTITYMQLMPAAVHQHNNINDDEKSSTTHCYMLKDLRCVSTHYGHNTRAAALSATCSTEQSHASLFKLYKAANPTAFQAVHAWMNRHSREWYACWCSGAISRGNVLIIQNALWFPPCSTTLFNACSQFCGQHMYCLLKRPSAADPSAPTP
jgi:hypothetical protein